jgi:hypothetical protein
MRSSLVYAALFSGGVLSQLQSFSPSPSVTPSPTPTPSNYPTLALTSSVSLSVSSTPTPTPASTVTPSGALSSPPTPLPPGAFVGIALGIIVLISLIVWVMYRRSKTNTIAKLTGLHNPAFSSTSPEDSPLPAPAASSSTTPGEGTSQWVRRTAEDGTDDVWYENLATGEVTWDKPTHENL